MITFVKIAALMICAFVVTASAETPALAADADVPVDTSVNTSVDAIVDTAAAVSVDTSLAAPIDALPPRPPINYTGAALSAVIPGAGQIYNRGYVMGGAFLAAEAIAGGMTIYQYDRASDYEDTYNRYRRHADSLRAAAGVLTGASFTEMMNMAARGDVLADQAEYRARQARYDALNTLTWTAGIHLFNFMDALERGGWKHRGGEKDPVTAALLAAVPFLGLGQIYNGRPGKAGMIAMTQTGVAVVAANHHRMMNHAEHRYDEMRDTLSAKHAYHTEHLSFWKNQYDREFSRRNTFLWIYIFAYVYGILDAAVDAHLSDYHERMRIGPDLMIGMDGRTGGLGLSLTLNLRGRGGKR